MAGHGVTVQEVATSVSIPLQSPVGIPFFIGAAPVHSAIAASSAGSVVVCTSYEEAVEKLGYSENWENYDLCEAIYSHFTLYGRKPALFCNLLDITAMTVPVAAEDIAVTDHKALLPLEALNDAALIVKTPGGENALAAGTDYSAYVSGEYLIVELLPGGSAYGAETLNIAYNAVTPDSVTDDVVAAGLQNIEKCLTATGIVPDLICAPGHSSNPTVAAVMATKAAGINGLFRAKALVDIGGAANYTEAITRRTESNLVDENQIICWPMLKMGERVFHMSTQLAGLIATVDGGNGGIPYESPSNKVMKCNAIVNESGEEVILTHAQANILNAQGITTALNFLNGLVCWGNYTACYPYNTDVKDMHIAQSRMFDFVGNTVIRTFWSKLDKPMNNRLSGNIRDTCNIWLNGLVGAGYLLGARVEIIDEENPVTDVMAGVLRVHIYMTPPGAAQEVVFFTEYDVSYVTAAFA